MRLREGSGRNLGAGAGSDKQESAEHQQCAEEPERSKSPGTAAFCACKRKRQQTPPADRFWLNHRR